mgnify:CR=1 FL=1
MNFFQGEIEAKGFKFYIVATNDVNYWKLPRTENGWKSTMAKVGENSPNIG